MSCEDQAFAETKRCQKWGCADKDGRGPRLVIRAYLGFRNYCCPCCGDSYGKQPHPSLPHADAPHPERAARRGR